MRLTVTLHKVSTVFAFKQLWKRRGYVRSIPAMKPWFLDDKDIVDPNKIPEHPPQPKWEPPLKDEWPYLPPSSIQNHPDYHEQPIYEYHYRTRLIEALQQVSLLTKTKVLTSLPESIEKCIGLVDIPNQDELVQRYIMQANIWDPTKDKLPKRINTRLHGWNFKAEYGIPQNKIRSILLSNLVRLCVVAGGQYPDLLHTRAVVKEPYVQVNYTLYEKYPIVVRGIQDSMVMSTRPLAPFANQEDVDESVTFDLPDIRPLAPTIDLKKLHLYKDGENINSVKPGFKCPHLHTLFMPMLQRLRPHEQNAKMLMFCFAHCLSVAKSKYGDDVRTLPEPITIQCVSTDGSNFHFGGYQLNTTNFDSSNGIKNFAWFDNNNLMYNKILPERAMLRNTKYEDYDPEVFKKILGLYVSGSNLK